MHKIEQLCVTMLLKKQHYEKLTKILTVEKENEPPKTRITAQ